MGTNNYCTYIRVSTQKQGRSGLGLDAQRKMCDDFIRKCGGVLEKEFVDVESGTHRNRKGLWDAITYCKQVGCGLVIAKLDRLARDVEFCFRVVNMGIDIHFTDMPTINTLLLGVFASVAQYERELTSDRTRKALSIKKAQGCLLGGSNESWREVYDKKKADGTIDIENARRGSTKNKHHLESRDVQAFVKILRHCYPDVARSEDVTQWIGDARINTCYENRMKVLSLIKDYKDMDSQGTLFRSWDFSDGLDCRKLQTKLNNFIIGLRKSFNINKLNNEDYGKD